MTSSGQIQSMRAEREGLAAELAGLVSAETAVLVGEPLARRTTLRVGGPADLFVTPDSEADLAATLAFCYDRQIPVFLLGRGSNLLVMDSGFRGAVICLSRPSFLSVEVQGSRLRCGAGARLKEVAIAARQNALSGLEFLEGIPGSVGGALRMNAGAMGGAVFDVVQSVRCMSMTGEIQELSPEVLKPKYRECAALHGLVAVGAVLLGQPGVREDIGERMNAFSQKRWKSQPAAPSAGCMFKNPQSIPAGKLIDELGLKGLRVGGAVVSQEHGNFIVNDGAATASDILGLIAEIRRRALVERGIALETEVQILGGEPE
jgi:UDP-N-acetylenolpyruvoylglucosamine reductase